MIVKKTTLAVASLGIALGAVRAAYAVPSFTTFTTLPSFEAGLGGAPTFTQDFDGFAAGTDLFGVSILPGVTASTNGATLEVFNSASIGKIMFGSPRTGSEFFYDVLLGTPYNAIAFDIQAFDPRAQPGRLQRVLRRRHQHVVRHRAGGDQDRAVFFGIIAGSAIASLRWNEPDDPLTAKCCEETGLDNFVVATVVPEPSLAWMIGLGLAGALTVGGRARRASGWGRSTRHPRAR